MGADEGLGKYGWMALFLVLLEVVLTLLFGPGGAFYISLLLAFVVLAVLALICAGRAPSLGSE